MFGTVIGDIIGSRFEFSQNKPEKDFELFNKKCRFTDDTVLTAAVCQALMESNEMNTSELSRNVRLRLQEFGRLYPYAGYGAGFMEWIDSIGLPYNSYGNGAGMRVAPVAWIASTMEEVFLLSDIVTGVTHNHPEGLKGARAVALAVFLARHGVDKRKIRQSIQQRFYALDFTIDEIKNNYIPNTTCQGTVPQAIEAFLEANDFENAIRKAVSIGGDTDTIASMTGAIAGAYYGIPSYMVEKAISYLDIHLNTVYSEFMIWLKR